MENKATNWIRSGEQDSEIDEDFPKTFAKHFAKQIESETKNTMENIANIWVEMGLTDNQERLDARIEDMRRILYDTLNQSLDIEKKSLQKLYNNNEEVLRKINAILSDLTLPAFKLPGLKLLEMAKLLDQKLEALKAVKKERMSKLDEYIKERDQLCVALNMKAKPFKTLTNIPNESEIMHLQSYVSDLNKEKAKRFKNFIFVKNIIKVLFIALEREVNDEFEKVLLFGEENEFVLSNENMKKLQNLHSELESADELNRKTKEALELRLITLYDTLDISDDIRKAFIDSIAGHKPSVLALYREEIAKYDELKRQNAELYIEKIRSQLEEWYEKCRSSDEQKDQFKPFLEMNDCTEELLEIHEQELQRLKNFYSENENILKTFDKWRKAWFEFVELENKSNDPNRFNNRGGGLLKEEKKMKELLKQLRKLETDVLKMFSESGSTFCFYGVEVNQYFEENRKHYKECKENEKRERQLKKEMELKATLKGKKMTPVGSGVILRKTPIGGGVVLRKTPVKRPLSPLPNGSAIKMRKIGCAPLTPSRLNDVVNCNTITKRRNAGPIARPRKRNLEAQLNQVITPNIDASTSTIDEHEFQNGLKGRKVHVLNSTQIINK